MRGARRRSVDICPVCGAPLAVPRPRVAKSGIVDVRSRSLRRAALRLACISRRHRSSSRWTLRSCHSEIAVGILVVGAINGRAWRTGAIIEVSLVDALVSMPSICLSACMNSRASGARCHKRRIGIAGMPEARSGQRGGKTGDDGVSHRLVPVRQYVTKHLFPAHRARDRTEKCRHRK